MSNSSRLHGLQQARPSCSSPSPRAHPSSCSLNWWYDPAPHPLLPSSPFPFCFSEHQSFPMSQFFTSGGQSTGASASASILPMSIQGWFPLGFTGLISLLSKGFSKVCCSTTVWKHQFYGGLPSLWSYSDIYTWPLERQKLWLYGPLLANWYLCFLIHCQGLS